MNVSGRKLSPKQKPKKTVPKKKSSPKVSPKASPVVPRRTTQESIDFMKFLTERNKGLL